MKRMNLKKIKNFIGACLIAAMSVMLLPGFAGKAYAADVTTAFGSNYYNAKNDKKAFPIGFYLRSQNGIGEYSFTIAYDSSRLKYEDGAEPAGDSLVTVSGNGNGASEVKTLIAFSTVSGGESGVQFANASVKDKDGNDMTVTALATAPVHITGTDTANTNYADVLSAAVATVATDENASGSADTTETTDAENADANTDGTEDTTSQDNTDSGAVDTADADDGYDINADTYRESDSEKTRKTITVVLIVVLVILLIIILFFINKLVHEGKELKDDTPKEHKGKKNKNAVERDEFDDSDDDGIWDDIKRKPRE